MEAVKEEARSWGMEEGRWVLGRGNLGLHCLEDHVINRGLEVYCVLILFN